MLPFFGISERTRPTSREKRRVIGMLLPNQQLFQFSFVNDRISLQTVVAVESP